MSVAFGAASVQARGECVRDVISAAIGMVDVRVDNVSGPPDEVNVADLGAVRAGELRACTSGTADRTPRHIRAAGDDLVKIDVVTTGQVLIEQDDRQARLNPGDFSLVDLSRPTRWTNAPGTHVVTFAFPRRLLPFCPDDVAQLSGVEVRKPTGPKALISSMARHLAGHLHDIVPADAARLGTAALDLITVALASRLDGHRVVPADARERALLVRIHAFIEDHLAEPDLTPAMVARAHHISLRSLYGLVEGEGTGIAGLIRDRRLERCRRDLLATADADIPICTIASRWGLLNPAHFSRTFKAAYGLAPAEYRRLAVPSRGPDGDLVDRAAESNVSRSGRVGRFAER
jgi:AraC-like DNA-binding protein